MTIYTSNPELRDITRPFEQINTPRSSLPSLSALPKIHYRNAPQVREFLTEHSEINTFLQTSWPALVRYFGQEVEVVLQVRYYMDEQAEPELVAWIQVYNDVETGMRQFDAFEEEWFLDYAHELNSRFNFNLEFK